jgi:hypothetical protein
MQFTIPVQRGMYISRFPVPSVLQGAEGNMVLHSGAKAEGAASPHTEPGAERRRDHNLAAGDDRREHDRQQRRAQHLM